MPDIFFYEVFAEEAGFLKSKLPKTVKAQYSAKTIQAAGHRSAPARCISIRTQSTIPVSWAPQLEGIITRSQGYDHLVAFQKQTKTNAKLGYLPAYSSRAVSEQAIMMMFNLLRQTKKQINQFKNFNRDGLTGGECFQRRALVVGVGNIGQEIIDLAEGLRLQVRGVDIKRKKNIKYVSLAQGLAWADIIFCALPLTEETRGLINSRSFKKRTTGKIMINVGRGEVTPLAEMKKMLDNRTLSGLGLDVFSDENIVADELRRGPRLSSNVKGLIALSRRNNVIFTPHNAFNTVEALERKAQLTVAAVREFLKNGNFPFSVGHEGR